MRYDYKCPLCGQKDVIEHSMLFTGDISCTNPDGCSGIMVKSYTSPPTLSRAAMPTRKGALK